jgi:hypothetical protein
MSDLFVSAREAWLYEPKLSPEARIVGLYLARRFEMSPEWHPRERDISERCGISIYAARKALIDLRAVGLLTGNAKTRVDGKWRNSPYRVTARLRDAALYWRDASPASDSRSPGIRNLESGAIYPQNDSDRPKGLQGLGSRPDGRSRPGREEGKAQSASEGAPAPERIGVHTCECGHRWPLAVDQGYMDWHRSDGRHFRNLQDQR